LWHEHAQELENWHGPLTDTDGRNYFVNSVTGATSWQDPRSETQYVFDLEKLVLAGFEERLRLQDSPNSLPQGLPAFGRADNPDSPYSPYSPKVPQLVGDAEVFSLEGPVSPRASIVPRASRAPQDRIRSAAASEATDSACRCALQKMGVLADRLHATCQDEVEVQRLQMAKKAKARLSRTLTAEASLPTRGETGATKI